MSQFGNIFDSQDHFSRQKFKKSEKRVLIKSKNTTGALKGIVYASMGKHFLVKQNGSGLLTECSYGATVDTKNLNSSIITVGDEVEFSLNQDTKKDKSQTGSILKVAERFSSFSRKTVGLASEQVIASNADNLLIIMAAADPIYNKRLIDRFLIAAEQGNLNPILCINKTDLFDHKLMKQDLKIYSELNIPVIFISAQTGKNFTKIEKLIKGKTTILAGPSGVGKSTIINKLLKDEIQKISEISDKTSKGKHTTSFSRMLDLDADSRLIDTPGIRELAVWNVGKEELPFFFHDFDTFFRECKYLPCSHTHEPDCAVIKALEEDKISAERYESYLNLLESVE